MYFILLQQSGPNLRFEIILLVLVKRLYFANLSVGQVNAEKQLVRNDLSLPRASGQGLISNPAYYDHCSKLRLYLHPKRPSEKRLT